MNTAEILIRRAGPRDEASVLDLWTALQEEQGRAVALVAPSEDAPERWANDYREWVDTDLRCIRVAERGGRVLGFVSAEPWYPAPIYVPADEVLVTALYVEKQQRRSGIGTALVEAVRAWAAERSAERVRLVVVEGNEAADAFWSSLGAQTVSRTLVLPA